MINYINDKLHKLQECRKINVINLIFTIAIEKVFFFKKNNFVN